MNLLDQITSGVETHKPMAESIGLALQHGRYAESSSAEDLEWMEDEFLHPGVATFAAGAMAIEDEENLFS